MGIEEEWLGIYGKKFIEQIGIQTGDVVIDFGCAKGIYSAAIAQVVGEQGLVHAIDNDPDAIDELKKKVVEYKCENIVQVIHADHIPEWIEEETIDFILCYDVLHYLERDERAQLYQDILPILKSATGVLSIHPKHTVDDDFPYWNFKDMTTKDVVMEVESYGYQYEEKITSLLFHNDNLEHSSVFNFIKKTM